VLIWLVAAVGSWDRRTGDILIAALSGISSRADVERYQEAGVAAVLIGETLMRAPDPRQAITELIGRTRAPEPSSAPVEVDFSSARR
jgi:thiamine monophosphate synthase